MDDSLGKPIRVEELVAALERVEPKERPSVPMLDVRMVESLKELGIWEEICAAFVDELPERLRALREALSRKAHSDVEHVAHAAKGSSGAVGAARMASMFARIEDMAEAGVLDGAEEIARSIEDEAASLRAALEDAARRGA